MSGQASDDNAILRVEQVSKQFVSRSGIGGRNAPVIRAVDNVSLHINAGETLAVVGESGSGKSTLGRSIVRAIDPSQGAVQLKLDTGEWVDLARLSERQLRQLRRHFHMIFQDPYSSLDPRMTVFDIIAEPLIYNERVSRSEARRRVIEVLELVGLGERHLNHYPHAFSGGQRQRIGIARALASQPKLIVCDEPVSALDVSIQAQVINLLQDLKRRLGLSYIFIAHDLAVVRHISDRVAVMYLGKIVELAPKKSLFAMPRHPYTQALLSAVPVPDPTAQRARIRLMGDVPSPLNPPAGCRFHTRCAHAQDRCSKEEPLLRPIGPQGQVVACHFAESITAPEIVPEAEPPYARRLAALRQLAVS